MRPVRLALILAPILALSSPALAQDWQRLGDADISATLTAHALVYDDGSEQVFFTDGRTLYTAGSGESWGKWWAEGGRYCSTWPPGETPACYDLDLAAPQVRFTSDGGGQTLGRFKD